MSSLVASLPDWLVSFFQWTLLIGELVATAVVGWGIVWESPGQSDSRHKIGKWLVIWGIVAETFCSFSLFTFDEAIARNQRSEIISLESRLAARSLTKADAKYISKSVGRFVGQSFEIDPYPEDRESEDFGEELSFVLADASWSRIVPPKPVWIISVVAGVVVYVNVDAPSSTKDAARALVDALSDKNIIAALKTRHDDSPVTQLYVTVGIKP